MHEANNCGDRRGRKDGDESDLLRPAESNFVNYLAWNYYQQSVAKHVGDDACDSNFCAFFALRTWIRFPTRFFLSALKGLASRKTVNKIEILDDQTIAQKNCTIT